MTYKKEYLNLFSSNNHEQAYGQTKGLLFQRVRSLLCVAETRATRPNGEWEYSTRRHMLGHECPGAVSPARSDSQHFKGLKRGVLRAFWDLKTENGVFFGQKSFLTQFSLFFLEF